MLPMGQDGGADPMSAPQGAPQGQGQPQGQGGPTPAGAAGAPDSLSHIEASYDKLRSAQGMLAKVRNGLDSLVTLGDTVTQDDVIKVAGKLVGAGLTPGGMASLLAEMPENPEQLMMWISQHDQDVTQREQQLNQMTDQFRHELGVQAMRKAMGAQPPGSGAQTPQAQPSQPMPSAPAGNAMSLQ